MTRILTVFILLAAAAFILLRYRRYTRQESVTDFAMGTVISAQVYGKKADDAAKEIRDCILELDEQELSWRISSSELGRINQDLEERNETLISEDMYGYLFDSLMICEESGGALDITIHPLIGLWGIETDSPRIPTDEELEACRKQYGYQVLRLYDVNDISIEQAGDTIGQNGTVFGNEDELSAEARSEIEESRWRLQVEEPGVQLDLGALGKGIAADQVRDLLAGKKSNKEIRGAVVSIGGTILTYGDKPGMEPWQVGIRNPRGGMSDMLGVLSLKGTHVVSTSGDYEQYFEENGIRYHHILDPATGYPADSGLMSVTIVCEDGIYSDGLSTACFVLGMEDSMTLLELYDAEAIFVTTERQVYVTDGIQECFQLTDLSYTLCEMDGKGE